MQAAVSDPADDVQAASVGNVVEGCLRQHFRYAADLVQHCHVACQNVSVTTIQPVLTAPKTVHEALLVYCVFTSDVGFTG